MNDRVTATFYSPTGGYVVVALIGHDGDDGESWADLVSCLVERGYVHHDGDGHVPRSKRR